MSNHTPTPWQAKPASFNSHLWTRFIEDKDGHLIARINYANPVQSEKEAIANADFIVQAVNNHAALVAALESLLNACELWEDQNDPVLSEGRQAIAKARGEA